MLHGYEPIESLRVCNSLLPPKERKEIVRAAKFAAANRHMAAETIRERFGYSCSDCLTDVDKIGGKR